MNFDDLLAVALLVIFYLLPIMMGLLVVLHKVVNLTREMTIGDIGVVGFYFLLSIIPVINLIFILIQWTPAEHWSRHPQFYNDWVRPTIRWKPFAKKNKSNTIVAYPAKTR